MKITVKEKAKRLWYIDVHGMLPDGTEFRKRTTQALTSETAARQYGEHVWKAVLGGTIAKVTPTVQEYATTWLAARVKRGLSSAVTNKYQLEHLMPELGHVRLSHLTRAHIAAAIKHMETKGERRRGSGPVAPRTVRHSYGTLRTMLADAVIDGHVTNNPATLRAHRGEVPTVKDKDPLWRRSAQYTADELILLVYDPRISWPQRVAYALEGFAGLRFGEASALVWQAWTKDKKPLGALDVYQAYDSNNYRLKPDKTDNPRVVPVHRVLAAVLADWFAAGWAKTYGRAPRPTDLVIPFEDAKAHRTKNNGYDPHIKVLAELEMAHRRQHDLRRTFITLCRAGGATRDILKWVSHGPPRSNIMDDYTSPPWEMLCAQVECLKVDDYKAADRRRLAEKEVVDQQSV